MLFRRFVSAFAILTSLIASLAVPSSAQLSPHPKPAKDAPPFDPAECQKSQGRGDATVDGVFEGNAHTYAPAGVAYLITDTPYTEWWAIHAVYEKVEFKFRPFHKAVTIPSTPILDAAKICLRETLVDDKQRFSFLHVPAGRYFVWTAAETRASGTYETVETYGSVGFFGDYSATSFPVTNAWRDHRVTYLASDPVDVPPGAITTIRGQLAISIDCGLLEKDICPGATTDNSFSTGDDS